MKQYRIKTLNNEQTSWSKWYGLEVPLKDHDILTVQFTEALTVEESKEFFKHFVEGV